MRRRSGPDRRPGGAEAVFAACAPGLEPVLAEELRALGLDARPTPGGADARGSDALALTCLGSRVAEAVAVRGGPAPSRGDPVGAPLFKRGWRQRIGAAPLRESLAAGLLRWAGHDGARPFLDPMCGSGTLAVEAALVARGIAPGAGRRFAFERWPAHDPERLAALRARLDALRRPAPAPLFASDRNAGALRLAQKNAAAAGVADVIRFTRSDAAAAPVPEGAPGTCVVNPPYGARLEEPEPAWRALAGLMERLSGWSVCVLAPEGGLERMLPGSPERVLALRNGGLRCRALLYRP